MWAALKRYGPDYCDLPTMVSNVSSLLRILAVNIDGRHTKRIPLVFIILTLISSAFYVYGYVFSAIWFILWRSRELGDLSGAFIEFSLNVTSEVCVVKLFYMMFYEKKMKQLTMKYLECDATIVPGSRYASNMLKYLRQVKIRGMTYWLILMIDAIVYVAKPLIMPGHHLTTDRFVIYGLEPMLESPNYEVATVLMGVCVVFICYVAAMVTCFLILMIGYIEAQMLSLGEELTHLWSDAQDHCKDPANIISNDQDSEEEVLNKYVKERLVDIISKHAMTKSNLEDIDNIMRVPSAIGFLLLVMGLIAELLGGLEQTWLQLPFTMLQMSIDCYLGQKLRDSNFEFERAVYECNWEQFNEPNKKIVLLMLQNSQKTMSLSAGGMATLSFTCLMSVIKTTYSAYTTLRSMV